MLEKCNDSEGTRITEDDLLAMTIHALEKSRDALCSGRLCQLPVITLEQQMAREECLKVLALLQQKTTNNQSK